MNITPKQSAATDQALRYLADLVHTYYQELLAQGFNDDQAMAFALSYQEDIITNINNNGKGGSLQ